MFIRILSIDLFSSMLFLLFLHFLYFQLHAVLGFAAADSLFFFQASYFTFHFLCLSVFPLVFCVHLCLICLLNLGLWSGASLLPFCYLYFDLLTFDFCCLGPILIELWHTIPEWRQSKNFNVQRNFLTCFSAEHMTIKALTLTWNHFPTWSLCQYFLFPAV